MQKKGRVGVFLDLVTLSRRGYVFIACIKQKYLSWSKTTLFSFLFLEPAVWLLYNIVRQIFHCYCFLFQYFPCHWTGNFKVICLNITGNSQLSLKFFCWYTKKISWRKCGEAITKIEKNLNFFYVLIALTSYSLKIVLNLTPTMLIQHISSHQHHAQAWLPPVSQETYKKLVETKAPC